MAKWVGRIFYAIIIVFMTFFIMQSAFDARSNAYLLENMNEKWDDEDVFFEGVNTLLNLDYITDEPIIPPYVDQTGQQKLTFQLYGIGYTDQEGNHLDGLLIFVNDLVIYERDEETGFLEKVKNPFIRLTIYTDEPIEGTTDFVSYKGFEGQNFAAGFIFDQVSNEVAYDLTMDDGTLATITRIDIDYSNGTTNNGELVYETESLMIVANQLVEDPVFEGNLKISDFSYDPEDYRLSDDVTTWPVTEVEAENLDLFITRGDLADYNWHMIRVFLLYGLFVVIITYLLFFHKKTMLYFREKRAKKHYQGDETVVEAETKPTGQIFTDYVPKDDQKGGK